MDLFDCLEKRRSCRAFLPQKIGKRVLERILKAANRSPSYMNSQPWEVFVVAGERQKALAKKLFEAAFEGLAMKPDLPFPKEWPEALERRTKQHRMRRFEALGINPEVDTEKVRQSMLSNFKFYDAPCVIFVGLDRSLTPWSTFDLGLFVHGLTLAAYAEGLGTCIQAMPAVYPDIIREELQLDSKISVILAISLGYADPGAPVNKYVSLRKDLKESVQWYGF